MDSPITLEMLHDSQKPLNFKNIAPAKEPMILDFSEILEYPGHGRQTAICQLDVYRSPLTGPRTWVFIATEIPENPGLSVTNGIEHVALAIEKKFLLGPVFGNKEKTGTYILVEHYTPHSYEGRNREDFPLINFGTENTRFPYYGSPDWIPVAKKEIERLIGVSLA
jgi:hypothetical protein